MRRSWFRPKHVGYGVAPATWEGWATTMGFVLLAAGGTSLIKHLVPLSAGPWRIFGPLLFLIPIVALFCWVAGRHSGDRKP